MRTLAWVKLGVRISRRLSDCASDMTGTTSEHTPLTSLLDLSSGYPTLGERGGESAQSRVAPSVV
jgi:hypothetical protein